MKIITETPLNEFEAWGGGLYTLQHLTFKQTAELEVYIADQYPEGIPATELNDLLWFHEDEIAQILGFDDFEDLLHGNKGLDN